jgi:hypothetical protein
MDKLWLIALYEISETIQYLMPFADAHIKTRRWGEILVLKGNLKGVKGCSLWYVT